MCKGDADSGVRSSHSASSLARAPIVINCRLNQHVVTLEASTRTWIAERISAVVGEGLDQVILFGSHAEGTATSESDIDLLVVVRKLEKPSHLQMDLRQALRELRCPKDVFVIDREEFERTRNMVGTLAFPAAHLGVELLA